MSVLIANGGATFIGSGELTNAKDQLGGATIAIIEGYTSIGANAFKDAIGLTSVTMPEGMTAIGENAFQNTGLVSITIPASVETIGTDAFAGSGLSNATVSVVRLGTSNFPLALGVGQVIGGKTGVNVTAYKLFSGTGELTNARSQLNGATSAIIEGYTSIADNAFIGAGGLTSVTIPVGVTNIGAGAFQSSGLTWITIPAGVTTIGTSAFAGTNLLTSMSIPASVTSMGGAILNVFYNAQLTTVYLPSPNGLSFASPSVGRVAFFGRDAWIMLPRLTFDVFITGVLTPNHVGAITINYTVSNANATITSFSTKPELLPLNYSGALVLPLSLAGYPVTSIGANAFQNTDFTFITIPASVTSIEDNAFNGASDLISITVDSTNPNYQSIGGVLFNKDGSTLIQYPIDNTNTNFTITANVTSIRADALKGATRLTSIDVDISNPNYQSIDGVLFNKAGNTLIQYPVGKTITTYTIPSHVTSIENSAFFGASALISLTLYSRTITALNNNGASPQIPTGGGSISSFYGSGTVTIEPAIEPTVTYSTDANGTKTATFAFAGSGSGELSDATAQLDGATIAVIQNYSSIGDTAFQGAIGLTSITIPASVTSIGSNTFKGASALASIIIEPSNPNYQSIDGVLFNKDGSTLIQYPAGKTSTTYTITSGVITIGDNAFFAATSLISINVDSTNPNYQSIDGVLFNKAGSTLIQYPAGKTTTTYNIAAGVAIIGDNAFFGTSGLTSITVDSTNPNYQSIDGVLFNKAGSTLIQYPAGKTSTTYTITSGVTIIGDNAFFGTSSLTSITVDSTNPNYKSIDGVLFNKAGSTLIQYPAGSAITNYIIPEHVISIADNAFFGALSLSSISIPEAVTNIGANTFEESGLTSASVSVVRLGATNFPAAVGANKTIGGKAGVTVTAYKLFSGTGELTNATSQLSVATIAVIEGYTSIGVDAFIDATGLTDVSIPASVTTVGANAFKNTGLVSITILSSVTSIAANAFNDATSLTSITVETSNPNYKSIDGVLFNKDESTLIQYPAGNTSETYNIAAGVTIIGDNAFFAATSLISINVDSTNPNYQSIDGVLFNKDGDTLIQYPAGKTSTTYTIPADVTTIGEGAFFGATSVTSITIPVGVSNIGTNTFEESGLTSATVSVDKLNTTNFPVALGAEQRIGGKEGVTVTGYKVFSGTGQLIRSNTISQLNGATIAVIDGYTSIGDEAFKGVSVLTSVSMSASVTVIGNRAFENAAGLTSIIIPSKVTSIGIYAFAGLFNLSSVIFEAGSELTTIGNNVFENARMTSITLPESVTYIGLGVFARVTSLTTFSIPSKVTKIEGYLFWGATGLTSINIHPDVTIIGQEAFNGASNLTSVTIPAKVTSLEQRAFSDASKLQTVTFAGTSQLTNIGFRAFYYASKLTSIAIPAGVTSIGQSAFEGATSLTSVTFTEGSKLTTIGVTAFQNTRFTSINIPPGVTSIGNSAFQQATALTSVTIVSSVITVLNNNGANPQIPTADGAVLSSFYGSGTVTITVIEVAATVTYSTDANGIKTATFSGSGELSGATAQLDGATIAVIQYHSSIGDAAFQGATGLTSVTIPVTVTSIGNAAFQNTGLTSITIPSSVETIGTHAFYQATALTSVIFAAGSKLTIILDNAFNNASSLTSIIIPASVTSIGNGAFYEATKLQTITFQAVSLLNSIGGYAFFGAIALTSIIIPANVTIIVNNAFENTTNLQTVTFAGTSQLTTIGNSAFSGASKLTSITIPAKVTSIGNNAFQNTTSMASITFATGSELTSIGISAFSASNFTSITIPEDVTSIGNDAFTGSSLTSAFVSVVRLGTTNFPAAVGANQTIGGKTGVTITVYKLFEGFNELTQAIVSSANLATNNITTVVISGYTSIEASAFFNETSLASITIPPNVTSIGNNAFQGASSLASVTMTSFTRNSLNNAGANPPIPIAGGSITSFYGSGTVTITVIEISTIVTYSTDANGIKTATFSGTGQLSGATAQLNGATIAIIQYYTIIGQNAFLNATSLTSVTLPESVTYIGIAAFQGASNLASVTIPASVTIIESFAFYGATNLTSVTFAAGSLLNSIGNSTFRLASKLTSIAIPVGVTNIGIEAFNGASGLTSITFEGTSKLTTIGFRTFFNAFNASASPSIIIPASVTSIGNGAFDNAGLTSVTFDEGSKLTIIGTSALKLPNLISINNIPVGVTTIGYQAFQNAYALTSVTFAAGSLLNSIADSAFQNCSKLASILIPSGVISIGRDAFKNTTALTSIFIPPLVTTIGDNAFVGSGLINALVSVERLGTINFPTAATADRTIGGKTGVTVTAYKIFSGTGELTNATPQVGAASLVTIDGYTSIGTGAFQNTTGITSLIMLETVTTIENSAFTGCSGIRLINIPASVTTIGDAAFSGMSSLVVTINAPQFTSLSRTAFPPNTSLTFATTTSISSSDNAAGDLNVYKGMQNIVSINIPASVTTIGDDAFSGMSSLAVTINAPQFTSLSRTAFPANTSLIFATTTSISDNADGDLNVYKGMESIVSVTLGTVTDIGNRAFEECSGITSINIPQGVTRIGDYAFSWCSALTTANLVTTLRSIGNGVFMGCVKLVTAEIPSSLTITSIPEDMFNMCESLTNFGSIPVTVTSVGARAFKYTAITSAVFPRKKIETSFIFGSESFAYCGSLLNVSKPPSDQTNPRSIFVAPDTFIGSGVGVSM